MKLFLSVVFISAMPFLLQAQNPYITSILNDIKIDSLVNFVENISGEKAVTVNGNTDTIYSRHKLRAGNELAYDYILQELNRYGLQTDSMVFSSTGKNALAIQPGSVYPDKYYILCAHYDDMPNLPIAPAADDDGSGVGALLEAARVLSKYQFEYTIIYAFWDEEEQGKVGSIAYANLANANNDSIMGVINMDAIAWDSDSDDAAMIHVRPIGNSLELSDTIQSVNSTYGINLNLAITNPGATYSDHASFWTNNFGAVLIIEDWTFDANPHYHTDTDLIAYFNLPYYLKLAKLSIASLASLATPVGFAGTRPIIKRDEIYVYPNPFSDMLNIDVSKINKGIAEISIYDLQGKTWLMTSVDSNGFIQLDLSKFPSGIFILELKSDSGVFRKKLIRQD
jgi:hypothetical protein